MSLTERFREKMEPSAAPLKKNLSALKTLNDAGCGTWVSIEPYPTPNIIEQDLKKILTAVGFVGKMIFGRMNYSTKVIAYKIHKKYFNDCGSNKVM